MQAASAAGSCGGRQPAVLAVDDEVEQAADRRGHHRHAAGQRLDRGQAERFEVRRLHDEVRRLDHRGDVGERTDEADAVCRPCSLDERAARCAGVPRMPGHVGSGHDQQRVGRLQQPPRLEQFEQPLLAAQAADEQADDAIERQAELARSRSRSPGSAGRKWVMSIALGRYQTRSRGTPQAERFALDVARDAGEGVGAAIERANRRLDARAPSAPDGADAGALQQRVDVVAGQHAGRLRLKHHRPSGDRGAPAARRRRWRDSRRSRRRRIRRAWLDEPAHDRPASSPTCRATIARRTGRCGGSRRRRDPRRRAAAGRCAW